MQERRNSIANALELRLSCTNPSICKVQIRIWMSRMEMVGSKLQNPPLSPRKASDSPDMQNSTPPSRLMSLPSSYFYIAKNHAKKRECMATVAFPWRAHGVSPRCYGVLTCDWLRGHGALMACSWRAKSCHCASTACTQRALRAQCVSTASSQSVNEHIKKSAPGILQKSPCI